MSADFYRRHMPHWQPLGAVFFVTFRLKFVLPRQLRSPEEPSPTGGEAFAQWDRQLETTNTGPHWLTRPEVARLVQDALLARDGSQYVLYASCIMPNHVHAVFEPRTATSADLRLVKIMRLLKGSTARRANMVLHREGPFWQDESFDHVVRDSGELLRIIRYVLDNPVRAGLAREWSDWPWTYCRDDLL